jgi:hypothetical protein
VADIDRLRELTEKALDEFESGKPVSALVRQAHRIAVLRHDYAAQVWFVLQQRDFTGKLQADKGPLIELQAMLWTLLGNEAGQAEYVRQVTNYQASREMLDQKGNIHGGSVDQLEGVLDQLQAAIQDKDLPANLTPVDAGLMLIDRDRANAKLIPQIGSINKILSTVRQSVHDFLIATEAELDAGREESSFFDQAQSRINSLLNTYAPDAAKNFVGAQDRLYSGEPDAVNQALTSCRRMIKSIADALYPATGEEKPGADGIGRKMSDEAYKNRLLQFVQETVGKHRNGAALQAVIADLDKRLKALDALSSKGIHAEVSLAEAQTCVFQVYLLAGDLLAIAEGTSPHLTDDGGDPSAEPSG